MIKIAIIDEGVDAGHTRLLDSKVIGYTIKESDGNLYSLGTDPHMDATGHGTAIASIIHKIVPEAELHSVRLFAAGGKISEQLLTEGIKHCLNIEGLRVVNISMGIAVSTPSSALFNACRTLSESGVLIVASSHNFPHVECFPAHFPFEPSMPNLNLGFFVNLKSIFPSAAKPFDNVPAQNAGSDSKETEIFVESL